jgi:hypothetical protein
MEFWPIGLFEQLQRQLELVDEGMTKWGRPMLGDYRVEIEDSGSEHVVLSIPALRLIVVGRTLSEAEELASAALAFRRQDGSQAAERSTPCSTDLAETPDEMPPPGAPYAA